MTGLVNLSLHRLFFCTCFFGTNCSVPIYLQLERDITAVVAKMLCKGRGIDGRSAAVAWVTSRFVGNVITCLTMTLLVVCLLSVCIATATALPTVETKGPVSAHLSTVTVSESVPFARTAAAAAGAAAATLVTARAPRAAASSIEVAIDAHRPSVEYAKRHLGARGVPPTSIALGDCANIAFSVPVTIGSGASAQTFRLVVDTGSTMLGVVSATCTSCLGAAPTYSPASTAVNKFSVWTATYGKGTWTGNVYSDSVSVGGLAVTGLNFGAITTQSDFFPNGNCAFQPSAPANQGIIGMSYSNSGYPSYATGMGDVLSMQLCESGGRLWLGTGNASYYSSGPYYTPIVPVSPQAWYTIVVAAMQLGATVLGSGTAAFSVSIVDSGSTLTYLPVAVYNSFVAQLQASTVFMAAFPDLLSQAAGTYKVAANSYTGAQLNQQLPAWKIQLGTGADSFTLSLLPVDSYLQQVIIGSTVYYGLGIIKSATSSQVQTILGYTVMTQFITIFDQPNNRVGFAPTAACQNYYPTGPWSACSAPCGTSGTQSRTVSSTCVNYLGVPVPSAACHQAAPAASQACNILCATAAPTTLAPTTAAPTTMAPATIAPTATPCSCGTACTAASIPASYSAQLTATCPTGYYLAIAPAVSSADGSLFTVYTMTPTQFSNYQNGLGFTVFTAASSSQSPVTCFQGSSYAGDGTSGVLQVVIECHNQAAACNLRYSITTVCVLVGYPAPALTTAPPTTAAPTTTTPTTRPPTTAPPTTAPPTTAPPTTAAPTTRPPTTAPPTTAAPTTRPPTTTPSTVLPTTGSPTTRPPTTAPPTTVLPTTAAPTSAPTTSLPGAGIGSPQSSLAFRFANFNSTSLLSNPTLAMNAATMNAASTVMLTTGANQASSFYTTTAVNLASTPYFSGSFSATIDSCSSSSCADGLAFTLQNSGPNYVSTSQGGYVGVLPATAPLFQFVTVAIKTYTYGWIGIYTDQYWSATAPRTYTPLSMGAGTTVRVWFNYNSASSVLSVFASTTTDVQPASPMLQTAVFTTAMSNPNFYVGFSGASGTFWEQARILSASFASCSVSMFVNGACVTGCAIALPGQPCRACSDAFFGPNCTACAKCLHGICNTGITGSCSPCTAGWTGTNCDESVGPTTSLPPTTVPPTTQTPTTTTAPPPPTQPPTTASPTTQIPTSVIPTTPAPTTATPSTHLPCSTGFTGSLCDQCASGYYGPSCTPCSSCQHGSCISGILGSCACTTGWAGTNCDECAAAYYGPACAPCSLCLMGACVEGVHGSCSCWVGWNGANCDECADGHFGADCASCNVCLHGTCTEGTMGFCAPCSSGWIGAHCNKCASDHFGASCTSCERCLHGTCTPGVSGSCSECTSGWAGGNCDECDGSHFGSSCAPCASCLQGTCNTGVSGSCSPCRTGWAGSLCSVCAPGYFGQSCTSCAQCSVHGNCTDGLDGACVCDDGWSGVSCSSCSQGYTGPSCALVTPSPSLSAAPADQSLFAPANLPVTAAVIAAIAVVLILCAAVAVYLCWRSRRTRRKSGVLAMYGNSIELLTASAPSSEGRSGGMDIEQPVWAKASGRSPQWRSSIDGNYCVDAVQQEWSNQMNAAGDTPHAPVSAQNRVIVVPARPPPVRVAVQTVDNARNPTAPSPSVRPRIALKLSTDVVVT